MECGTFTFWLFCVSILLPISAGQLRPVTYSIIQSISQSTNQSMLSDGQEVTNEEIEFTPLPTEPSELSSLTAMIRKTATD